MIAARAKAGSGGGEVIEAIVVGGTRVSMRAASWKAIGYWIAIVSGASIEREGPLIQFGGSTGGEVGRIFQLDDKQIRSLVAAGTAAGFAAASAPSRCARTPSSPHTRCSAGWQRLSYHC